MQVKYDLYGFHNLKAQVCLFRPRGAKMITEERAKPLVQRSSPNLVNFQDRYIFLIGGASSSASGDQIEFLASVHVYSPDCDSWFTAPDLNEARINHSSCVVKDAIYTFCG